VTPHRVVEIVYLKNGEGFMKIRDYIQLMKPSLSIMVVFSSVISYLLAPKVVEYDWLMILLLFVGGKCQCDQPGGGT
jgi:protoheme IX farnesyltransferase